MTFQQLKYVIKIVETGSISRAAKELFVSQPSLSKSVMDLEHELGVILFVREKKGIRLTDEGRKFAAYASQVLDQMDLIESEFKYDTEVKKVFSVSSQHYNFVVSAFAQVVKEMAGDNYEFSINETNTAGILDDVSSGRSEIGIIYLSKFNGEVMKKTIKEEGLEFHHMFRAEPHVCINEKNPLADKEYLTFEDLSDLPRIIYEQNVDDSFFFYEELYSTMSCSKDLVVSDRSTLVYLLDELGAYTISTKVLSDNLKKIGAVTIPLKCNEHMDIGYVKMAGRPLSETGKRLLELAKMNIEEAYKES